MFKVSTNLHSIREEKCGQFESDRVCVLCNDLKIVQFCEANHTHTNGLFQFTSIGIFTPAL